MPRNEQSTAASRAPVPLTILTGFLGAGKTTLLNHILNGGHGLRVAVLVNDFGTINIDADLIVGVRDDVVSLANGCICCTIRDDLVATVLEAIDRPEAPDYILLEASGIADPAGISLAFLDANLKDRLRLDSVICVVDAEQVFKAPEVMELKLRQIAFSDMIILNKTDLIESEALGNVRQWLNDHFHRFRLFETSHAMVPLEILLAAGRYDPSRQEGNQLFVCSEAGCGHDHHHLHHHKEHAQAFSTWSYETDLPISLEALHQVARTLPSSIYRSKGVINSANDPSHRAILQVVGKRAEIAIEEEWGNKPARTRIVVIGCAGTLPIHELQTRFDACQVVEER